MEQAMIPIGKSISDNDHNILTVNALDSCIEETKPYSKQYKLLPIDTWDLYSVKVD